MFVHRIVLVLLVLSWSVGLAHAQWVEVGTRPSAGGHTIYADPTTRRIDTQSGLVRIWSLSDYTSAQKSMNGSSYLSVTTQLQCDCKEARTRILASEYFGGNKAQGDKVYDRSSEGTWEPLSPGTIAEQVWKFACNNTKH